MATEPKKPEQPPRVFVSYSWSSPAHEEWVLHLATELCTEGVDVVLDKWDLKEGQDKYEFMEGMVTDASISKVLLICDRQYAEKANKRKGGVGAESQIISPEIYGKAKQDKFIPVVAEVDEEGNPYVPTFIKTRIHIDISTPDKYHENYDRLLRVIFNRPLYQKPEIGPPPKRLLEDAAHHPSTAPKYRACLQAVRQDNKATPGLLSDYYDSIIQILPTFRITGEEKEPPFDEKVIQSIAEFLPYRDEFLDLWHEIFVRHADDSAVYEATHGFLENLIPFKFHPPDVPRWNDSWADNYSFCIYELFLYLIALLIKHERCEEVHTFLEEPYFIRDRFHAPGYYGTYDSFFASAYSLDDWRNKRLKLQRMSVVADLIKERTTDPSIPFESIMLADFVIMLWTLVCPKQNARWYPKTLVYAERFGSFEFFARAASHKQFDAVKTLLKVKDKDDLAERLAQGIEAHRVGRWHNFWGPIDMFKKLMNLDELDTI